MDADLSNPSERPLSIIHLEDNLLDRELVAAMLRREGIACEIVYAEDAETFGAALCGESPDLIISDFTLPGYGGVRALELARRLQPAAPIILFSGTLGEEAAVECLRNGATDYVLKQRPVRLIAAIRRALAETEERAIRRRAEEELSRRTELFRQVIGDVDDLIVVVDLEGRCMLLSPSYHKVFGGIVPRGGDEWLASVEPADHQSLREAFAGTVRDGRSRRVEFRQVLLDGGVRFFESQCSAMRDEKGRPKFVLWVSRDITERRFTEERLREQATLLDQAQDAICVLDFDQRIRYWNKSAERLYGWAAAEALGREANELLMEEEMAQTAYKALRLGGKWQGRLRQTNRAGVQLIVKSRWTRVRGEDGGSRSILIINTDVTEQVKAEEKIQEQAALLDKARDAILLCNLSGEIAYWNEGAARLYGWTASRAVGRIADELLDHQDAGESARIRATVIEQGEWVGELRQVTALNKEVIVQSHQTLVRNKAGAPISILSINSDITEKKQIEQQFLRTQRLENLGALAGGIAHDLNNILGPIMLAVELVQADVGNPANESLLETVGASARRGADLVKQILSFARGASSERAVIDFGRLIAETLRFVRDTFPRNIEATSQIASELPLVWGDASQFHQILLNLCVNARDAMPAGGRLTIEARKAAVVGTGAADRMGAGEYIEVRVSDTGTGIPPEVQSRIFEPFFTTKEPGKGTGLGLSTVRSIVQGHGGFLELSSEEGQGATFSVYLPTAETVTVQSAMGAPSKPPVGRGELILVVDDEIAIVETTSAMLAVSKYGVLSARDGIEALAVFAERHAEIALVVTDMMMPAMGGEDLVAALRRIKPDLKIIVVSGLPGQDSGVEISEADGITILKKPYSMTALLKSIRECLDS